MKKAPGRVLFSSGSLLVAGQWFGGGFAAVIRYPLFVVWDSCRSLPSIIYAPVF